MPNLPMSRKLLEILYHIVLLLSSQLLIQIYVCVAASNNCQDREVILVKVTSSLMLPLSVLWQIGIMFSECEIANIVESDSNIRLGKFL